MGQNEDITARYLDEPEFREAVGRKLLQEVYDQINSEQAVLIAAEEVQPRT